MRWRRRTTIETSLSEWGCHPEGWPETGLSEGGQFLPAVESHVRQAEFSGFTQMGQIRSRALKGIVASSLFACVKGWACNRLRVRSAIVEEWVWCRIKL